MLRTEQILNAKFTPVSKGTYSADEVDAFLKIVAESYDALSGEKAELIKKISILADKIESYRKDEEAIKLSLLDAHRMAETINKNAQIKSDTLIGDAETRAQLIVDGANRQSAKLVDEAREEAKNLVENARAAVNSLTERAQTETDSTISAAKEKAEQIVADATAESENIIGESKKTYEYYVAEIARLKASAEEFKTAMASLCNDQLASLESVPVIEETAPAFVPAVEEFAEEIAVAEDDVTDYEGVEETESELPFTQGLMAEIENEIAAIEENDAEEIEAPADELNDEAEEEQVIYVPEEPEIAEEDSTEETGEAEVEDLFSLIDEMNFEDIIAPNSVAASIDDIVPEISSEPETDDESDAVSIEDEDEPVDVPDDDDDDDFFGFKVDLDSITDDDGDDDGDTDDISSLFDSMFDD